MHRVSRARSDRGAIVIVALMVLFALAGLALVGVRIAQQEIRASANYRLDELGVSISDASSQALLAQGVNNKNALLTVATAAAVGGGGLGSNAFPGLTDSLWDLATDGTGSLGLMATSLGAPNFSSTLLRSDAIPPPAGFSIDSGQVFCVMTMDIDGTMAPTLDDGMTAKTSTPQYGGRTVKLRAAVGPYQSCQFSPNTASGEL